MSEYAIKREPRRVAVAYRQRRVFAEGLAFSLAAERMRPVLERSARVISRGDYQLAQDMVQEALIDLWDFDISRYDAEGENVLKKVLADRMRLVRRQERRDSIAARRVNTDPDEVTEEGVEHRSVRVRRALELLR
jgi:DNA-directed RNA polymerase specialized sigma24 family protein